MTLFDSHAHYNDEAFGSRDDRNSLLKKLREEDGVKYILCAGTNPETSRECLNIAHDNEGIFASVGIHPSDLYDLDDPYTALNEIKTLATDKKTVAIGEIGLDYHWHTDKKDLQKDIFQKQLLLAKELDLPVIIHDREAHGDCLDIVLKNEGIRGVFHCFSGSKEMAIELLKRSWYISFMGVITFKNASRLLEVAQIVPDDRLLVETHCHYLTTHPFRSHRNASGYMKYTIEKLAELRGVTPEHIAEITLKNTVALFNRCKIEV